MYLHSVVKFKKHPMQQGEIISRIIPSLRHEKHFDACYCKPLILNTARGNPAFAHSQQRKTDTPFFTYPSATGTPCWEFPSEMEPAVSASPLQIHSKQNCRHPHKNQSGLENACNCETLVKISSLSIASKVTINFWVFFSANRPDMGRLQWHHAASRTSPAPSPALPAVQQDGC